MLKSKPVPYEPFEPRPRDAPAERVKAEEVLTSAEIRDRLAARERSIGDRLAALKSEVTTIDDLTVGGRPALDHVRAHPVAATVLALTAGALVGVAMGALGRALREEEDEQETVMRLLADSVIEDAARRAALGADPEKALKRVIRRRSPFINYKPADPPAPGTLRQSVDLAVKSAVGFGVKAGLDMLTKQLTGKPEVISAVADTERGRPAGA